MENRHDNNVWYIPQGVSFEIIRSILAHCYNSQKKNQVITKESIKKTIPKTEKVVGYATKMLENIGILNINKENDTYHLNEVSMIFAEKVTIKEDVTKEANQIIENSYLDEILQIIINNEGITKQKLVEKILINSAAGNVKDNAPYMTTIHCILDMLNLTGKISVEKFVELRGNPEQTVKKTSPNIHSSPYKKKEKHTTVIDESLPSGIYGLVKTTSIEVKILSTEDIAFARLALDKLEKDLSNLQDGNKTTDSQTS